jgi:4-amino-4-deoxy-L-arabinose transferase-like glycosyltransferase
MVRDYISHSLGTAPLAFAENYYLHYPEVAFGHWPPAFYLLQAAWTLIAPVSHTSLLLLMAIVTASTATALDRLARGGLMAALVFVALPITQIHGSAVMAEAPLALFSLLALVALIRLLEQETVSRAVVFGVLASAAILTKPSAWSLALVPIFSLLLLRRPRRLLSPPLLLSGAVVAVLCVPYHFVTLKMARAGMEGRSVTGSRVAQALVEYLRQAPGMIGFGLLVLVAAGLVWRFALPLRENRLTTYWAVMGSFILAAIVFHAVVPTTAEPRKIFMILPALLLFAIAGAERIAGSRPLATAAIVFGAFAPGPLAVIHHEPARFASAAEYMLSRPDLRNTVSMVCSSVPGSEGAFIAEVASRETRRPTRFVLRASKQLTHVTWNGLNYKALFRTPAQMSESLTRIPVGALIIETPADARRLQPHEETLRRMLEQDAGAWEQVYSASRIVIYRRKKELRNQPIRIEIDLRDKLDVALRYGY